jgi:hypothetical protein
MMQEKRLSEEGAEVAQGTQAKEFARFARRRRAIVLRDLRASFATSALSLWTVTLALGLAIGIAGCGTKTELLKPNGKPTPHNERDPSQPPSPISR